MLKIEKYKEEIENVDVDIYNMGCELRRILGHHILSCSNKCSLCLKQSLLELLEEYKESYILTKYEFETLNLLSKRGYLYVVRNYNDNYVNFHNTVPTFNGSCYFSNKFIENSFDDTFEFIEKETIYEIEEILSNCEVIESD